MKMPINIQKDLPARELLEKENIFIMDEKRAVHQDIRPIRILILNLMPLKEDTELQLLRSLSNTPLQVDITFLTVSTYQAKNTSPNHLNKFYNTFDEIKSQKFDGFIITGAPVEKMEFEEVDYWNELTEIMDWSEEHVTSTLHICWGAQAALYHHYGIDKKLLPHKLFGLYWHRLLVRTAPIARGFDDVFLAPHSRYTDVAKEDLEKCEDITIIAESDEAGVYLAVAKEGKQIFVLGHPEYDRVTLDDEYQRDRTKGLNIDLPLNYYPNGDYTKKPPLTWRSHANNLYTNWLNYYVYQLTPYRFNEDSQEL